MPQIRDFFKDHHIKQIRECSSHVANPLRRLSIIDHKRRQRDTACYGFSIDYIRPMDVKLISATDRMLVSRPYYNCISIPTVHSENHP